MSATIKISDEEFKLASANIISGSISFTDSAIGRYDALILKS
jgi:hypothetical protein